MDQAQDATQDKSRHAVSRYYDRNTRGFLAAGEGGKSLAIHRGIWEAGTATAAQAAGYVPALMLAQARQTDARNILDLGCGVGGTCLYLAQGLGVRGPTLGTAPADLHAGNLPTASLRLTGMTISEAQVRIGRSLVEQRGHGGVVNLMQGDYTDPASFAGLPPQDLVLALESFVHSPDLHATLANASGALRPGGRLVICDDMIAADPGPGDRDLEDFRRCWHAYGLCSRDNLATICQDLGLQLLTDQDLTPKLRLFRLRDKLAAFFLPVLRLLGNWPWSQNLVGGTALQRLLARGSLSYRYQVWLKPDEVCPR